MPRSRLLTCPLLVSLFTLWPLIAQEPDKLYTPDVKPASQEGERAMARFKVPPGFKVELWAAEPMLANPVCFTFDEKGRVFVAETFRLHAGVTDIRGHMNWLDDDLACRTVEDRDKLMRKWLGKEYPTYGLHHDRIRLLEDTKGTGKADKATTFADGFRDPVSGIGAGLLAENGKVWFACIPHLWLLEEKPGTGQVGKRTMLSDGYGIHIGYLGHDLHGLIKGPDGRLYFSLGDRGCHLKTKEGKLISNPDSGCVLRCEPDGSNLELYATGLRNPQELAFDEFGNLFTVDNNSDGGDKARLTYIVEGGDYGWRIGYQFLNWPVARGPWNAEGMWVPEKARDVAYMVPSIANISDGPSGLAYYPGVGLPDRYKGHFFLADFRGGAGHSGVRSFAVDPHGAGFKVKDDHQFLWSVLATDVAFGPDCAMYVSDWVDGWGLTGKGRIYKVYDPEKTKSKEVEQVRNRLEEMTNGKEVREQGLWHLLGHADARVRMEAQQRLIRDASRPREGNPKYAGAPPKYHYAHAFLMATYGPSVTVMEEDSIRPLSKSDLPKYLPHRIQAFWGLGQLCRDDYCCFMKYFPIDGLSDRVVEARAQAARLFGEVPPPDYRNLKDETFTEASRIISNTNQGKEKLIQLLQDSSLRVRFFAAQSLGTLKHKPAVQPLLAMLRANNDQDPFLRHAGVLALVRIDDRAALHQAMKDESAAVRLAVCVALRRLEDRAIAQLLDDVDPRVVLETARAIYDAPIPAALPKLASLSERRNLHEAVWFRVLNAHFRLGQPENAKAIAGVAARVDLSENVRREALYLLGQWEKPSGRDRLVGLWRPLPNRPKEQAATAFKQVIAGVLTGPSQVRQEAVRLAAKFDLKEVGPQLVRIVNDPNQPAAARVQAMEALQVMRDAKVVDLARQTLKDVQPRVRAAALTVLAKHEPREAWPLLEAAMQNGHLLERQAAITALATIDNDRAEGVLAEGLERLMTNQIPEGMQLELVTAARKRSTPRLKTLLRDYETSMKEKPMGTYRLALAGGDVERGKNIFLHKEAVSCLRCHKVGGNGGEVGPDLSKLGGEKTREYLLESLVDPNKQIAKGFDTVIVLLHSGQLLTGVLKGETATELKLMTPEGKPLTILKKDIEERQTGKSSMPDDVVKHLSLEELRDVVEFLAGQK